MIRDVQLDFRNLAQRSKRKVETFIREFCQDMAEEIVQATPVDTGFLRGSWFIMLDDNQKNDGSLDPSGSQTIAKMSFSISNVKPGDTVKYRNSAHYGAHVEYGTMYMAPRAFVGKTVDKAPIIAEDTILRIKR